MPVRLFIAISILLISCNSSKKVTTPTLPQSPTASREFRAAWVATVANINWPSKPGLSTEQQQAEAITLLDFLKKHNFNAVVLQIRPQADALYKSNIEPWSYYLTGTQGKAPSPYYDPLEFWVKESHDRGIELHVWLNPYRAHHKDGKEISDQSVVKQHPDWVMKLKEGYWWMDPANKHVQDQTNDVVMDVVKRYDIDGIHMDDYFYPYPSYHGGADFPDSLTWNAYQRSGGTLSRGDWRRDAVNQLIERLYNNIRKEKPWVKFGLSPFGIWRPGHPASVEGFDQYDQLYADAKLWLNKGWIDYFAPQLYWPINRYAQSFPVLLGWWAEENTMKRHLWPGISVNRDTSNRSLDETINQIMIDRGMQPNSSGVIHWSISSVTNNPRLADTLIKSVYRKKALVPASPWMDNTPPAAPDFMGVQAGDSIQISWTHADEKDVFLWVVYYKMNGRWSYDILDRTKRTYKLKNQAWEGIVVRAVDRVGNESLGDNN